MLFKIRILNTIFEITTCRIALQKQHCLSQEHVRTNIGDTVIITDIQTDRHSSNALEFVLIKCIDVYTNVERTRRCVKKLLLKLKKSPRTRRDQFSCFCTSYFFVFEILTADAQRLQYNTIFGATPAFRVRPSYCFLSCGACNPEQT